MRTLLLALSFMTASLQAAALPAPAFAAKDATGRVWTLADAQSKPLLVDFWATWCKPCLESMPDLNAFYKAHQAKLGLLGLNLDTKGWATAKPIVTKYALSYPVAVVDPKLSKSFGAKGFPFLAVLYQGKIVKTLSGAHRLKELEKELAPWL